jgi:nitrogen fixation protein NifX
MLRIAFASGNRETVDQHFGKAERLVLYDVVPGRADLVACAAFAKAETVGTTRRKGLTGSERDKVADKLDFVKDCHAVFATSIGASSIRRLMAMNIQPVIVEDGHSVRGLLSEIGAGMARGDTAWIERAKRRAERSPPPLLPETGAPGDEP